MNDFDAFARFYDADYGNFSDDLPFYRELAQRTGGPILELMCGTGRVLVPLAQAGHHVTGVDIAPALLEQAQAKLHAANLDQQVTLITADARVTQPAGPFVLAIVALNSFMHLETVADQLALLTHTHAALQRGGLLVLDLFNPDGRELASYNGQLVLDKTFALPDGSSVQKLVAQSTDLASQSNHVTFLYDETTPDGTLRRHALPFTMRWLYRYELEHLLARAGFVLDAVYGSYELDDYTSESERMLTVAVKV